MTQKPTKRSHTVQKAYLKYFSTKPEEKNPRVMVNDKKRGKTFSAAVQDITVENDFYKLPSDFVEGFIKTFPEYENVFKTDFVETYFNTNFEKPYLKMVKEFFSKDYFPNELLDYSPYKVTFSSYIAIQFMRTRNIRKTIESAFASFDIEKEYHPLLHFIHLLNDKEKIKNLGGNLYDRLWKIYVNETSIPYKTSDNPVVLTEKEEIVFPFSSKYLIFITNELYNSFNIHEDLKLESITDEAFIEYFNQLQEDQCQSQVIWEGDGTI